MTPWIRLGLAAAMAVLAFSAPAQSGVAPISPDSKARILERMGSVVKSSAFVPGRDFTKWDEFLEGNKEAIDKAGTEQEFAEAVNAALAKFFGVSHIVLVTPRAAKARQERKVVGVGIQVQLEEGGLKIVHVFPDTPASEAGLQVGDLIQEADGKKLTSTTGMLGEEGTQVTIKVLRETGAIKEFTLTRRKYSNVRPDTLEWIDPDTALVRIHTFDVAYSTEKVAALMAEAFKAKRIILDLRANGGGVVLNMLHLLGYFLPNDASFGAFVSRSMVQRYVDETGGKPTDLRAIVRWAERSGLRASKSPIGVFKGHVAVLINGGTGSASEITAKALKELRGAPVIGTKSAGAVLVSVMTNLPEGWVLQYPLMDYISSDGTRLEGVGVEPDVVAETPRPKEPDTAIEKAMALLRRIEIREERYPTTPPPTEPRDRPALAA